MAAVEQEAIRVLRQQVDELRHRVMQQHGRTHEIAQGDEYRPSVQNNGTQLDRYRTTNFSTNLTAAVSAANKRVDVALDDPVLVDAINESTSGAGVTVDGLLIKDGEANLSILNGAIVETIDASVSSNGTTITFSVQKEGGGNLTLLFSDGFFTFTAAPATIALTAGSATVPQSNYLYILKSDKLLTKSTSGFPSAEHAPLATVIVQTAALVQNNGALKFHAWTDHLADADNQGQLSHFTEWIREQHASWTSGVSQTLTITGGSPDTIDFATTSGVIFQLHPHTMPAKNTASPTDSVVHVVNDNTPPTPSPYTTVTDLADLLTDNAGVSMSGKYFNLVIWASISEAAGDSQLFVNLPGGSYNKQTDAEQDVSGYTVFDIPADFKGAAFLISRLLLKHSAGGGGTWTSVEEADLRGKVPSTAAGTSTQAIATTFADNAFKLFDEGDVTRLMDFQLSGISPGNTRTITMPDGDVTLHTNRTRVILLDIGSCFLTTATRDTSTHGNRQHVHVHCADGVTSSLFWNIQTPKDFVSDMTLFYTWVVDGVSGGNVNIDYFIHLYAQDGETAPDTGLNVNDDVVATPSVANESETTSKAFATDPTAGDTMAIRLRPQRGNANDTNTDDMRIIAAWLEYTGDH